jgi:hypothetical protein
VKTQHVIDAVKEERLKHEEEIKQLYAERDEMEMRFEELEGAWKFSFSFSFSFSCFFFFAFFS